LIGNLKHKKIKLNFMNIYYKNSLTILFSITSLFTLLLPISLCANNIKVSNFSLIGQDFSAGTNHISNSIKVKFDLRWENSWRTSTVPNNWDAAWVFIKYRVNNGNWEHAYINNTGHTAPAGSIIEIGLRRNNEPFDLTSNQGVGALIYRNEEGNGDFILQDIRLQWNYRTNPNLQVEDVGNVDIRVFAIEMVYVPEGAFYVGSGGTPGTAPHFEDGEAGSFTDGSWTSGATIPFRINNEDAINIAPEAGSLWGTATEQNYQIGGEAIIPDEFPKGFAAFYCMKYDISQQQYVDFLNSLNRTQQNLRTEANLGIGVTNVTNTFVMSNSPTLLRRNGIRCNPIIDANDPITFFCDLNENGIGNEEDDGTCITANYNNTMDIAAYLDWSGLRFMTELEFEKACRGINDPVPNESAWGSTSICDEEYLMENIGKINERVAFNYCINSGNASYRQTTGFHTETAGPIRVGTFATSNSNRIQAGASYYGIMDLTGNLWGRFVTVANLTGREYNGNHGDGTLSISGNANVQRWPGTSGGEVNNVVGYGFRGGDWGDVPFRLAVSSRWASSYAHPNRTYHTTGRGCRSKP